MNKLAKISTAIILGAAALANAGGNWASIYHSLIAFDERDFDDAGNFLADANRPGYVKPIINNLGNVLNSNWFSSASVPNSLAFEAGLPISIIPIGDDDREYAGGYPTIFGGDEFPYVPDPTGNIHCNATAVGQPCNVVNGNETLNGLGVFTYPYLQIGASMFHARAVLRWMMLPPISELRGFSLFGFGLQYSFGHFFQYMVPPAAQGLDVSLVWGYNTSSIGYQPEGYKGELDLDISAWTISMVVGYKPIQAVEIMMSLGYQAASMESSGKLTNVDPETAAYGAVIKPTLGVKGNNGFRFGLEVAFHLGASFNPVVGIDYAGKASYTTNILYFKQQFGTDKTPNEIAKEKGYDRNAKPEPAVENQNDTVREAAQAAYDEPEQNSEEPEKVEEESEQAAEEPKQVSEEPETESDDDFE